MARGTCCWKTGIYATSVALRASQPRMSAGERERGDIVIERGRQPGGGGVTGGARSTETAIVLVIAGVTCVAIRGGALVDPADMAGGAGHTGMRAGQFEGGQVVVEGGGSPCERGVAEAAIGAEGTLVGIIGGVAGVTIDGCAGIDIACMAGFTWNLGMLSNQREIRPAVVEAGRNPAGSGMADATICPERALVGVIRGMAGVTIGGCRPQVRDGAGTRMTGCAGDSNMFACQLEWEQVMVKIAPVGIDAIMACQAVAAKGEEMLSGEGCIHLFMADPARFLAEGADIAAVTVAAKECSAGSGEQVSSQGKAQRFMGEIAAGEIGQGGRCAAMVGMTIAAGKSRVGPQDGSMQGGRVSQLAGNIGMAGCAAGIHAGEVPEGGMAEAALPSELSMGNVASDRAACLGIEGTGAEQYAAFEQGDDGDNQDGQPCDDESSWSHESETLIIHALL